MNSYFSETLNKNPDWFWHWVEYNQTNPNELIEWFYQCTEKELIDFYTIYFDEIYSGLPAGYEGLYIESLKCCLSEDSQADFNNWIIVQGNTLWEVASTEAMKRLEFLERNEDPDDKIWESLFAIYDLSRVLHKQKQICPPATWNGITWNPRDGYFPGDHADLIYEERFGKLINE
jgi:hypothetical protein